MMVIFLFRFINFNSMTVLINNSFSTKKKNEIGLLDFCSVVNSCTKIKKIGWDTWH